MFDGPKSMVVGLDQWRLARMDVETASGNENGQESPFQYGSK